MNDLKNIISNPIINENDYMKSIGLYIDESCDKKLISEVNYVINILEKLDVNSLSEQNKLMYHLFISTAYSEKYDLTIANNINEVWKWEQILIEKQILNLRIANQLKDDNIDNNNLTNIFTNLANRYNNIGRFLYSFDYWNKAIEINPNSGLPFINMGNTLAYYGINYLNENKYQYAYIQLAHHYLNKGISRQLENDVIFQVKEKINHLEKEYKYILDFVFCKDEFNINYKKENKYFQWCEKEGLFLNPLSNINLDFNANMDDVFLVHSKDDYIMFFEDIKSDYIYARKEFYKSLDKTNIDSLQLKKSSFRIVYSLFDKIAYLLSFLINYKDKTSYKLNFCSVWYENLDKKKKTIQKELLKENNLMYRGLYWVSKDIYIRGFENVVEPKAKEINIIRNFIEHKNFQFGEKFQNDFIFQISIEEFNQNMITLFKSVRESILYLSYSQKQILE